MQVSRLPERSIQSPTRLVCSTVNGGSTRTASVAPEMSVVEIGDHCCGAPVGSVPAVGICADTNTSYDSAVLDSDMHQSLLAGWLRARSRCLPSGRRRVWHS